MRRNWLLTAALVAAMIDGQSTAFAAVNVPSRPGYPVIDPASPDLTFPVAATASRLAQTSPLSCAEGNTCTTITSFPYTWNGNVASDANSQYCWGSTAYCATGYSCTEPLFSDPNVYNGEIRQCNHVAGNGEMFAELAGSGDSQDGNIAVGFVVTAPRSPSNAVTVTLNANPIFQYEWNLPSNWPASTHCSGRISFYVQDLTNGKEVKEADYYPYVASQDRLFGSNMQGTTGAQWYEFTGGMSSGFAATSGHEYVIWVWAQNENNAGNNESVTDGMSFLVSSVMTSFDNAPF